MDLTEVSDESGSTGSEYEVKRKLEDALEEKGLDSRYWIPELKNCLSISSIAALKYVDNADFRKLKNHVRSEWEKKALMDLFDIEIDQTFRRMRDIDREKARQMIEDAKSIMDELNVLKEEGKKLSDGVIQQKLNKAKFILKIPDYFLGRSQQQKEDLNDVINGLQNMIGEIESFDRKEMSERDLLEHASAGLALKGVLLNKHLEDGDFRQVLSLPSDVKFLGPAMSTKSQIKSFISKTSECNFAKTLHHYGYSMAASVKGNYGEDIDTKAISSYESDKEAKENHSKTSNLMFYSQVKYQIIPLASFTFAEDKLKLTEECIKELLDLELIVTTTTINDVRQKACESFFRKFGSHVNCGPLHFGGVFYWMLEYQSEQHQDKSIVKHMCSEAMSMFINTTERNSREGLTSTITASDLLTNNEDNIEGKYSHSDLQNISFRMETKGGPPECASSLLKWKKGLAASNTTWSIVDRGLNFKGIWELLKNHSERFTCVDDLESALCEAWQSMTGLQANQYLESRDLIKAKNSLKCMLSGIPTFLADEEFPKNCVRYLQIISELKVKFTLQTLNPQAWNREIQKDANMATFMNMVWKHKDSYDQLDISTIKSYLKKILADADGFEFENKTRMIVWIHSKTSSSYLDMDEVKITDIMSFISKVESFVIPKLQKGLPYIDNEEEVDRNAIEGTRNLSILCRELLKRLKNDADINLYNLLKIILLKVNFNENVNGGYLSYYDVTFEVVKGFLEELQSRHERFMNLHVMEDTRVNGFILDVAYHAADKKNNDEKRFQEFMEITKMLDLKEETIEFLKNFATPLTKNWNELKSAIDSLRDGTDLQPQKIGENLNWFIRRDQDTEVKGNIYEEYNNDGNFSKGCEEKRKIIDKLGLTDFYPKKISIADIRKRRVDRISCVGDLPWFMLQKILLLDYRVRDELRVSTDGGDEQSEVEDNDEIDLIAQLLKEASVSEDIGLNPMDVVAAVFLCSSNFLKQIISQKLCMTKLSIPFLIQDVDVDSKFIIQVWPLRDIILNEKEGEVAAFTTKIPIITFVRNGEISRSKSKLLNDLLSNQSHNIFFHEDCMNGNVKGILSSGNVDVSWFIPSATTDVSASQCNFQQAMMFLNLHGRCGEFEEPTKFLCGISNLMVVMMDLDEIGHGDSSLINTMKTVAESSSKVLLIVTRKQGSRNTMSIITTFLRQVGFTKKFDLLLDFKDSDSKNKNFGIFKREIVAKITKLMKNFQLNSMSEVLENPQSCFVVSDEDGIELQTGKKGAEDIQNIITDYYNSNNSKTNLLPLQGELWKEWSEINKKENRISETTHGVRSMETYKAKLYKEKQDLRKRQISICETNQANLLKYFVYNLLTMEEKGDKRSYFLHSLRMNLNELSRTELPAIEQEYSKVWSKIQSLQSKEKHHMLADQIKYLKLHLKILESKLDESSFGLEHLFREMGQLYEAVVDLKDEVPSKLFSNIKKMSKIMAELLLDGQPLEIMDGNTAHVPIKWIQAVLGEVKSIIGDGKNIFVLSIIGVQSSGKSTLLNALFGLQFNTRAGRCTQGMFAQLVRLPEINQKLAYDYILVVDTEGLRAPELGLEKRQNDNELATMAIGMSDLTLFNIKGENHSEIENVLQIVVHAFVRMQIVNKNLKSKKPSCFFIHQNVDAGEAEAKVKRGKKTLLSELDKMTEAAAYSEKVTDLFRFTDVINFDVETNVKCFANLWQGAPPMAPVNPDYSEQVNNLKNVLYSIMSKQRGSHSSIEHISMRIGDVWSGILADNFVFNFKNSLEIRAYQSLELQMNNLMFGMKNDIIEWYNDYALGKIRSTTAKDLESVKTGLEISLNEIAQEKCDKALCSLNAFFDSSKEALLLEQWRVSSEINLNETKDDIKRSILKAINDEAEVRKLKINQKKQFSEWNESISAKTNELAINLRGKDISENDLDSGFDSLWTEMIAKKPPKVSHDSQVLHVENEVYLALSKALRASHSLLKEHLNENKLESPIQDLFDFKIKDDYYTMEDDDSEHLASCGTLFKNVIEETTQSILKGASVYLKKIEDQNFSKHFVEKLIEDAVNLIDKLNSSDSKYKFIIKQEYKVSLLVHICRFSIPHLKQMHETYKKKVDPKVEENRYKEGLLVKFKNIYADRAKEKIVADQLCHILKDLVHKKLMLDLPRLLVNEVRDNYPFLCTAGQLKRQVLEELLRLDSFEHYVEFLSDNRKCIIKYLREYTAEHLFNSAPTRYGEISKIKLNQILMDIEKSLRTCFSVDGDGGKGCHGDNQEAYWDLFAKELQKNNIPITIEDVKGVVKDLDCQIEIDFKNFSAIMFENLSAIRDELENEYQQTTSLTEELEFKIIDDGLEYCLGCPEQCPFCKAPCKLTSKAHCSEGAGMDHCVIEHYPPGICGNHWVTDKKLIIATCPTLISSEYKFRNENTLGRWSYYKDYKEIFTRWNIPRESLETSCYWKRFMAKFNGQLAQKYKVREGDVPKLWYQFTKEQALDSINTLV